LQGDLWVVIRQPFLIIRQVDNMSFNFLAVDSNKKVQGVWVEHETGEYRIGSPDAMAITKCLEKHTNIVKGKRKDYTLKASEQFTCQVETTLELKLLDWRNVKDVTGKTRKFSHNSAFEALVSDMDYVLGIDEDGEIEFDSESRYETFFEWINKQSETRSNFELEEKEQTVKKSQSSSSGSETPS
jgi:hypothetical protein